MMLPRIANTSWIQRLVVVTLLITALLLLAYADVVSLPYKSWLVPLHGRDDGSFEHPIPKLMDEAREKYRAMMMRQSQTLEDAVHTYEKRYSRPPPFGFDDWWNFTQENNVKIIDEYDSLVADLEPFWTISGEELRRRAFQAGHLPSINLVRVQSGRVFTAKIDNGYNQDEVSARANGFVSMIEKFTSKLPDMDFPVNGKAEGRVLVPWEFIHYPNVTLQNSSAGINSMIGGPFVEDWRGEGTIWESYRRTCPPNSLGRRLFESVRKPYHSVQMPIEYLPASQPKALEDFQFAKTVDDNFDFCNEPWARYNQGHFFSDWRIIPVLYPVFSPAKAPGFSDIMIPSHYYYGSTRRYTYGFDPIHMRIKETDDRDIPWSQKKSSIFWRGATTGGGSSPPGYLEQYQRHRLVRMASDQTSKNHSIVFANPPDTNSYVHAGVPVNSLNMEFLDVAFTSAVGCMGYPGGCEQLRRDHRFADAVQLGDNWKYKYVLDLDGMGYSARFFAFLASDSAVMKATVYKEFYTDWIQPWLHYIPLSSSYKEVYNIYAYFSGPTESMEEAASTATPLPSRKKVEPHDGDAQLRRIAKAGRQWKATIGRNADMEAYVYRLCLEYARLSADDREAMAFKLP